MEEEPVVSAVPLVSTRPQKIHDLVTFISMAVGTFKSSKKTEILIITLEDQANGYKVIKRKTRNVIDTCQVDLIKAQMTYDITETSKLLMGKEQ